MTLGPQKPLKRLNDSFMAKAITARKVSVLYEIS